MKNIKLILFSLTLIFASCGDDTYSIEYTDTEVKTPVSVTVDSRDRVALDQHLDFTVTLSEAYDVNTVITVAAINSCGDPISHLKETSTGTVTVTAGSTTGTGSLFFASANKGHVPAGNWDGLVDCAVLSVTGIALSEGNDPYVASDNSTPVTVIDTQSDYMAIDEDAVVIVMDWKNPGDNDIDMYVTNGAGTAFYEIAETGSRYEGDYFDNDSDVYYPAPDGDYIVWWANYIQENADVPAELFFTKPVSGEVVHIPFTIPAGAPYSYYPVATITKSTDADGNMSYEIAAY